MSVSVDHLAAMRARLISQFQGLPNLDAFIHAAGDQLNDIDEFFGQLASLLTLQTAVGAQLDVLGVILGQSRNGLTDSPYRTLLQARVSAYASTGSVESLIQILMSLGGAQTVRVLESSLPDITVTILGLNSPVTHRDILTAMQLAKPAGVSLTLNAVPGLPAFQFDATDPTQGAGFDVGHLAGTFT
jgi:hypothetical protein